ncbi:MAG TPA: TldD/PmbA family protein [Gemmatimonadaceae bacterium]|nr:TldD/PmbA family protein [Gemmatimonadaceae bacterium]
MNRSRHSGGNGASGVADAPRRLIERAEAANRSMQAGGILSREEAQALIERVKGMSKAEAIKVSIFGGNQTNVRFADNQMSTAGSSSDFNIQVESWFGNKHAVVVTNNTTEEALRRTVDQSERLAKLSPDDPENMPGLGPQNFRAVDAWFPSVADMTAEQRAKIALTALEPARAAGDLRAAGFLINGANCTAIGNDKGLFAYHRSTNSNYTLTVRTTDGTGSGWAGAEHNDAAQVDFESVSRRAIEKARLSRNPVAVEPGRYTVILEPQAVGDLAQLIGFYANARSTDEGRSPFVKEGGGNKIGEKIVDERISIYADPHDPMVRAQPFDFDGLPLSRQVFVENGVLKTLYYSRFWAQKKGVQPTGAPTSFLMSGGDASIDDMIRNTERGILVTRLWYLREVDPRTILYTGLTRDGTFLVENGRIARAVKNFRFNDSPLFMLNNLEAIGRPVRLAGTEAGGAVIVPPLKVRDFNFTSLSDAV